MYFQVLSRMRGNPANTATLYTTHAWTLANSLPHIIMTCSYLEEHIEFHHALPQSFTHVVDSIFSRLLLGKRIQQPDKAQTSQLNSAFYPLWDGRVTELSG